MVFEMYPELLKEKREKLQRLQRERCLERCNRGQSNTMWCLGLPWCRCEVKTLYEEVEGECKKLLSAREHVSQLLGE